MLHDILTTILPWRRRLALGRLTCAQLDDERIRLESIQEALIRRVQALELSKRSLFEEGVRKSSDIERRALAVKIKQVDEEARDYQAQHLMISNRIQLTGKLIRLKRQMELIKDAGLWSLVARIEPSQIESFVLETKTRARQGDRQAARLLEIMGDGDDLDWQGDPDVERIVETMTSCGDRELDETRWQEVSARLSATRDEERDKA